jgi:hypothetical protein
MKNIIDTTAEPAAENPHFEPQSGRRAQLDLSFNGVMACARPAYRRQMLRSRAAWWFQQMRRAVDSAVEWRPAPAGRPEQGTLDLRRPTRVTIK